MVFLRKCPSRLAATGQSPAWPGVSTSSRGRPCASVSAWILVVSPPRERPIQRSGWLFLSWRHADARAPRCCRSSADHLHIAVVGLADGGHDAVPNPGFAPPHKAVVAGRRRPILLR